MLASCYAAHNVLFSAGLCLLVATNVIPVHSQNSKCEGSRISVAKHGTSGLACAIVMRRGLVLSLLPKLLLLFFNVVLSGS